MAVVIDAVKTLISAGLPAGEAIFEAQPALRVFLRRTDLSRASATSALEISPVETFSTMRCHMSEKEIFRCGTNV